MIYVILIAVFALRLVFLKLSKQNEMQILADGGREFGQVNTKFLTLFHIFFYLGALIEAIWTKPMFDQMSLLGFVLLLFSMWMLWLVTRLLGKVWTVKLMLLKDHQYVDHWLFRHIKHPNYFLNIVPELVGLSLMCHAKWTFICVAPLYAITLFNRIREEEMVLKEYILPNTMKG